MFCLPEAVQSCLDTLEAAGFESWVVGGAVRDLCRGKIPADYDLATAAEPEVVAGLFERVIRTGIRHGTVTVCLGKTAIEVTTFRTDGAYTDRRRPDRVVFVGSIDADLARRDFTVNAIAYHPARGLYDPFDGRGDLEKKLLRTVGDPLCRFSEDALRILRLYRFACQLDFRIDPATADAAKALSDRLRDLSRERIRAELLRALCSPKPGRLADLLDAGALAFLGVKSGDLAALEALPDGALPRFVGFCRLIGCDPDAFCLSLRTDNRFRRDAVALAAALDRPLPENLPALKRQLRELPPQRWGDLLTLHAALCGSDPAPVEKMLRQLEAQPEPYLPAHLPIDGKDLRALGFSGRQVGEVLEALLNRCIDEPSCATREALLELAHRMR